MLSGTLTKLAQKQPKSLVTKTGQRAMSILANFEVSQPAKEGSTTDCKYKTQRVTKLMRKCYVNFLTFTNFIDTS